VKPAVLLVLAIACVSLARPRGAQAAEPLVAPAPATFALIIGSNVSVDRGLPPLKYADDDAAGYLDLFRLLGARTYLLTRLDENTRRLHPQAAAEALEPVRATLERTMLQIKADILQARERHVEVVLYVVYAGHGGVDGEQGYITIEDMRITGDDLGRLLAPVPATSIHIIADACSSYFLAYSRGPGGERRPLQGLEAASQLASDPRVGLLLSTSSARESHEWDAVEAGVFSHEVRSGLYGAADADGDGRVSYREIAAFVSRANEAIPNQRFRPDVHIKAPAQSDTLLDLRQALGRRLDLDGSHAAHYWIEDERGVRLADFHNSDGQAVHVVRPPPTGRVYVRRVDDDAEFTLPAGPRVVALADLENAPPRVASRGAAHDAFSLIFTLPFDRSTVDRYMEPVRPPDEEPPLALRDAVSRRAAVDNSPSRSDRARRVVGWSAIGLGVAGLGVGTALSISSIGLSHGVTAATTESAAANDDHRISTLNTGAAIGYVGGGLALGAGLAGLLFLPASVGHIQAGPTSHGASVGYTSSF
jgi:hypothetical protein